MKRVRILINGIVQGVGFRPFVYRLAEKYRICGFVKNTIDGVLIEAQGKSDDVENFVSRIQKSPPSNAKIKKFILMPVSTKRENSFVIMKSNGRYREKPELPPDIAICDECLKEILDEKNRRFAYPFTNCVNCGPRFTIIKNLPYDRENTSMDKFQMCKHCQQEYENPENRRFHAQTNCCAVCGPQVFLVDRGGNEISRGTPAIKQTAKLLMDGKIVALKGIGGFHLACNAFLIEAVRTLRQRKNREEKPFALMARNLEVAEKYCYISEVEKEFILSSSAPIVLLKKKKRLKSFEEISLRNDYLGIMLPYTPLHHLIFTFEPGIELLVMTSGNYSEQPICTDNQQALSVLHGIADFFLFHDREIVSGCDDSVMRVLPDRKVMVIRRSRGIAPESIILPFISKREILGCGGNMKNTFSLVKDANLYISHHIGDIDSPVAFDNYTAAIKRYIEVLKIKPDIVAYDAHPEYASTMLALSQDFFGNATRIPVYHHHAHVCACMVENNLENTKVIGVAFDGTGYGKDDTLWGSEFLVCDYSKFERVAHLMPVRLPGGEQSIKNIWRIAVAYIMCAFGPDYDRESFKFLKEVDPEQLSVVEKMIITGINSPYSSGMGRLFDAVSCICSLRTKISYEGQAASELEYILKEDVQDKPYEFDVVEREGRFIIDHRVVIKGIVNDIMGGKDTGRISHRFHLTVVEIVNHVCNLIRRKTGIQKVVLSGGSFQNVFLSVKIRNKLERNGFTVYSHSMIPPNDGCVSVGQCAVASFYRS